MAKYIRSPELVKETVEYLSGAKTNWCTGCYRDKALENFTTMLYKGQRRLISWCKDCVKARKDEKDRPSVVLVNRGGVVHYRRRKGAVSRD